jgi:outer membrane protein assembly factor BamB
MQTPSVVVSIRARPLRRRLLLACLLGSLAAGTLAQSASAEPAWTSYHRDSVRSGEDPEATQPLTPALAWHSQDLGAPIWSEPLILGEHVYVATVGDQIAALSASTGAVQWEQSVGTPVPSSALPCGDITPTVGIVGTPVIDPATNAIYAVADTWNGSTAQHVLVGLNLATGAEVLRTPVDPPSTDPKAILQRTALNLDAGHVVFGYGGNDGDCSDYVGAVVSVPENGGAAAYWQVPVSAPSTSGGAIWATSGPAVGPEGDIFATTGNPVPPGGKPGPYDYSDSVVQLNSSLGVIGSFEPPNWKEEGENDLDLSSAGAELLPGGLLFQAGKDGRGYLIAESTMVGMPGAGAVFEGAVCAGHGSFGGDAFAAGVIYVACTNGVQALAYDQAARTFTPLWQGPSDAFGPPIVSAGLVWDIASGGFSGGGTKLYGLDPASGQARYSETLPSPVADHFASPSAAGGRLFLATGSTETAYQIAQSPTAGGGATPIAILHPGTIEKPGAQALSLLHTRLRADRRGRVRLALRCSLAATACKGTLTLRARFVSSRHVRHKRVAHVSYVTLGHVRFDHGDGSFAVIVHLGRGARRLLHRHHGRLTLQVILAAPPERTRKLAASLVATR